MPLTGAVYYVPSGGLSGTAFPQTRNKTARPFRVSQIFIAELGDHALFLIRDDKVPKQMQHRDPQETNPLVEKNGEPGSPYGNKRGVERMTHPAVGSLRA